MCRAYKRYPARTSYDNRNTTDLCEARRTYLYFVSPPPLLPPDSYSIDCPSDKISARTDPGVFPRKPRTADNVFAACKIIELHGCNRFMSFDRGMTERRSRRYLFRVAHSKRGIQPSPPSCVFFLLFCGRCTTRPSYVPIKYGTQFQFNYFGNHVQCHNHK